MSNPDSDRPFADGFMDDYFAEADEHLVAMRRSLLALEGALGSAPPSAPLEELFRSFHSLKGISAMVELREAELLAHHMEGCLRAVRQGELRLTAETFDALVNPGRSIPLSSVAFHGITDAMAAEAPPIDVVLPAFLRFAEGSVVVGHQVWFDLRFLERVTRRLGVTSLARRHAVLDTLTLSEVVHGPLQHHGLDAMATRLGVAVLGRHSALGDALVTAEIFVRLIALLRARGIRTLGDALEASRQARRFPSPRRAGT